MANGNHLLSRSVHVHPVFLLGAGLLLVSLGALLGQTLFAAMAGWAGVSVVAGAGLWIALGVITMILGILRSFEGGDDAE